MRIMSGIATVALLVLAGSLAAAQDASAVDSLVPDAGANAGELSAGTTQQTLKHIKKTKKKTIKAKKATKVKKHKKPVDDDYTGVTIMRVTEEPSVPSVQFARPDDDPYAKPNQGNEGGHYYAPGADGPEPTAEDIAREKAKTEKDKKEQDSKNSNKKDSAADAKPSESKDDDIVDGIPQSDTDSEEDTGEKAPAKQE